MVARTCIRALANVALGVGQVEERVVARLEQFGHPRHGPVPGADPISALPQGWQPGKRMGVVGGAEVPQSLCLAVIDVV